MFLLDTNVVSEALKPSRNQAVEAWFNVTDRGIIYLSSITKAELLYGLAVMPVGKRKLDLANVLWLFLAHEMHTDVLEFGSVEAEHYAEIAATRRGKGRPISQSDAQIAAIARPRGFANGGSPARDDPVHSKGR
jgi:toxin FitB